MITTDQRAVLIFDLGLITLNQGRLFDAQFAILPGVGFYPILADKAKKEGITCLTIDQYLEYKLCYKHLPKFAYTYEAKPHSNEICERENIVKFFTCCGESPLNSKDFYRQINRRVHGYQNLCVFSGARKLINLQGTVVHDLLWPNTDIPVKGDNWENRRLVTFVCSPKSKYPANFNNPLSRLARYPRYIYRSIYNRFFGRSYGKHLCIDLTQYRRDAIKYFSQFAEFQLYGKGWSAAIKYDKEFSKFYFANSPLSLQDKHLEVGKYRYVICFENTIYPGYITEKIFDAMLGGAVPIWRGCDDIYTHIPEECFIDAKKFNTFQALHHYLVSQTKEDWLRYRKAIDLFLKSSEYVRFTGEYFSSKIVELLKANIHS